MKDQQPGPLTFIDLVSEGCEPQTIYSISNACGVTSKQTSMAEGALQSVGHEVLCYNMRKHTEGGDDDVTDKIPPADYVLYSGCARSSLDIELIKHSMDMCVGERAIKGLFLMGCIKDVNENYTGQPFGRYLRETLGLGNDCMLARIDLANEHQFGFINSNTYHIESGCLNGCNYCMGNFVDNREPRSADPKRVIEDLKKAYDEGLRIIKINGENVALFGVDFDGKQHLHELIWEISKIGFTSVFIHNIAPQNIYPELVEALKMAPHIDGIMIAVETPDEQILQSIGRGGTADVISDSLREIREEKPWFYADANMITGLPGETNATHQYAKQYLRDNGMIVGVANALQSHESLPISKLPNQVDRETAKRRERDLYNANGGLIKNYMDRLSEFQIGMPLTVEEITDAVDEHGSYKSVRLYSPFKFAIHTAIDDTSEWAVGDTVQFYFHETRVHEYENYPGKVKFYVTGQAEKIDKPEKPSSG